MFPDQIAMPNPDQISCFTHWIQSNRTEVCTMFRSISVGGEQVFPEDAGLDYDALTPQLVWRGYDGSYLKEIYTKLQKGRFLEGKNIAQAARMIRRRYDRLLPRWKGVVHTFESIVEANGKTLPLVDIRISSWYKNGEYIEAETFEEYQDWIDSGFPAIGKEKTPQEMATFKVRG